MRAWLSANRQLVAFFIGSGIGVTADMAIFFVETHLLGVPPWIANTVSATVGIVTVYFLVTRHSFNVAARWTSFVVFIGWYATTIATFSWAIQSLVEYAGLLPLVAKICTLPVSFTANYLFSRFLFARVR